MLFIVGRYVFDCLYRQLQQLCPRFQFKREALVWTQVQPLSFYDQIQERQIDSSLLSCRSKLLLSKLAAGLPHRIYHFCSTFSRACLLFFTEVPPPVLLMLGLYFAHPRYVVLFLSVSLHYSHFLLRTSFTFLSSDSATKPFSLLSQVFSLDSFFLSQLLHRSPFCVSPCLCLSGWLSLSSINGLCYLWTGEKSQVNRCF